MSTGDMPVGSRREAMIVGVTLVVLGATSLREGWRLYQVRETLVAGTVVGDDTFPLIVGAGLVVLGVVVLVTGLPGVRVTLPEWRIRGQLLGAAVSMLAYCVLAPWLGYTAATAIVAVALFRAMGGLRWAWAVVAAAVVTAALYLMFRVWLLQPLPSGLLGG